MLEIHELSNSDTSCIEDEMIKTALVSILVRAWMIEVDGQKTKLDSIGGQIQYSSSKRCVISHLKMV